MNLQPLQSLIGKLRSLPAATAGSADAIAAKTTQQVIDLNIIQLSQYGIDSNGDTLKYRKPRKAPASGVYSDRYTIYKAKRGGNVSFVDLRLTGEFYASIYIDRLKAGEFKLTTQYDIAEFIEQNYSDHILGLTQDNGQKYLTETIAPEVQKTITQHLAP
jgi:hypothetical protein